MPASSQASEMLLRLWVTQRQCELLEEALREKLELSRVLGRNEDLAEIATLDKMEVAREQCGSRSG